MISYDTLCRIGRLIHERPEIGKLGCGYYGVAKERRDGWVTKISPHDYGYRDWIEALQMGRYAGPFVPKLKRVRLAGSAGCLVIMERLYHASEVFDCVEEEDVDIVMEDIRSIIWHGGDPRDEVDPPEELAMLLDDGFLDLIDDIMESGDMYGYYPDLHGKNIMFREDGTPVVTDPWCGNTGESEGVHRWAA